MKVIPKKSAAKVLFPVPVNPTSNNPSSLSLPSATLIAFSPKLIAFIRAFNIIY